MVSSVCDGRPDKLRAGPLCFTVLRVTEPMLWPFILMGGTCMPGMHQSYNCPPDAFKTCVRFKHYTNFWLFCWEYNRRFPRHSNASLMIDAIRYALAPSVLVFRVMIRHHEGLIDRKTLNHCPGSLV